MFIHFHVSHHIVRMIESFRKKKTTKLLVGYEGIKKNVVVMHDFLLDFDGQF